MAKNNNLGDFLTGIADKLRGLLGESGKMSPQAFETKIQDVYDRGLANGGPAASKITAKAGDVVSGKIFGSGGPNTLTGTMPHYPDTYTDHTKTEVIERDYLAYHIPRGAYTVSGGPYIRATKAQVTTAIGLTVNKIACGNTVLGVVGSVWVPVGIALACAATSGRSGIVITGGTIITNGYGTFSGGNSYDSGSEVAGKDVTSKLVFTVAKAGKYRVSGFQNTNIRFVRPGNDGSNHGTSGTAATSYAAGAVSLEVGSAIEITATADGVDYDSVNCGSLSGRAVLISYVGA